MVRKFCSHDNMHPLLRIKTMHITVRVYGFIVALQYRQSRAVWEGICVASVQSLCEVEATCHEDTET